MQGPIWEHLNGLNLDNSLVMVPAGCNWLCRACAHREFTQEQSLEHKLGFVCKMLKAWEHTIEPVRSVSLSERWHYRAKVSLNAQWLNNQWTFGTLNRDEFIPIPQCPIHAPIVAKTIETLQRYLPSPNNFELAFLQQTQAQCVMVLKQRETPDTKWFSQTTEDELRSIGIEGFWIHLNPSAGRRMFEKTRWINLFGEKRTQTESGLWYGPGAFQQLIPKLYNESVNEAKAFLKLTKHSAVVDLYCGVGATLREWIGSGSTTLGVELSGEAIECAKLNVPDANILRGACRHRIPQFAQWTKVKRDEGKEVLLYVNPPRTGIESQVLEWIAQEGKPLRIAYLSCSPGTLSKNLTFLCEHEYRVTRIIPYDFFPQTKHIECLALVELRG